MRPHITKNNHGMITAFVSVLLTAAFFMAAIPASAEDAHTAKLIAGAKKEGKVVFYSSWSQKAAVELVELFQKKYPFIRAELTRAGANKILNRVLVEDSAGKRLFDAVTTKGDIIDVFKKRGLLARYDSPERRFYAEKYKDKEGFWTDSFPTIHSLVYNTRMVKPNEVPRKYQDLLNPKWKGLIGINLVNFMWGAVVMQTMGEAAGLQFLEKLADQKPQARNGTTLNVNLVGAGEHAMAVSVSLNAVVRIQKKGAPIDWARMDEPYYADLHPVSVGADAPHPNAAKLLVDFCLSEEGQNILIREGKIPPRTGLKPKFEIPADFKILDPALSEKTDYYQKLMNKLFVR